MEKKDLKVVDCEAIKENTIKKEQDEIECTIRVAFESLDTAIKEVVEQGIIMENALYVEPDAIGQFIEERLGFWGKERDKWNPENILELIKAKTNELKEITNE